jgi:hypothetical protein
MNEYRALFPEETDVKNDDDDDYTWGQRVGTSHGLLEGVLWRVERVCKDIDARLDSDWALCQFMMLYERANEAFVKMLQGLSDMLQNRLQEECTPNAEEKIIPLRAEE